MNAIIDSLLNHKSIRKFKDKPIDEKTLNLILEAGIRAPNGANLQRYSLVVIDDQEQKKALQKICYDQQFIGQAAICIAALVDMFRLNLWFELNDAPVQHDSENNLLPGDLFGAYWDAILALHNAVIAAESMGLGTCYVGSFLTVNIQEMFNAPEHVFPAGLVCIGYPDEEPELEVRLPLEAVIHRNNYQIPTNEDIKKHYRIIDKYWEKPSERKKELEKEGIHNIAQYITNRYYPRDIIISGNKNILENIRRAKINLTNVKD